MKLQSVLKNTLTILSVLSVGVVVFFHSLAYYISWLLLTGKVQIETSTYPIESDAALWHQIALHGYMWGYLYSSLVTLIPVFLFMLVIIAILGFLHFIKLPKYEEYIAFQAAKGMFSFIALSLLPMVYGDFRHDLHAYYYFTGNYFFTAVGLI